jgi:hypothetical protein
LLAFHTKPPFNGSQFEHHRRTMELLRGFASAADAARDATFANSLADTLRSWDVGVERHSQSLAPEFREQVRGNSLAISELEHLRIDDPSIDVERAASRIWHIIRDLDIVRYKDQPVERKVVSGTKVLHHLLPNLVCPMDNEYTANFFGWNNFGSRPEQRFRYVFGRVAAIARAVSPQQYVGEGWNSSISKVLDNAIVGFCLSEDLMSSGKRNRRRKQAEDRAILAGLPKVLKEMGLAHLTRSELTEWLKKPPGTGLPPEG